MRHRSFIDCDDYNVGSFTPVSFTPKLHWEITESEFIEHPTNKLHRSINIQADCYGTLLVGSHPYSGGMFYMDHYELGIREKRLFTNDPEEALYIAETSLKKWAERRSDFYRQIVDTL